MKRINTAELKLAAPELRAGDEILLSGTVYTARDAAHKRIFALLDSNGELPFDISGSVIYYAGPTPAPDNMPIGSCGPTTSGRMDCYAPRLYDMGMLATIGKGDRSTDVHSAIIRNRALYLCAIGGAGALCARSITSAEVIAFPELGCESVKRLTVKDFPLFVGIDAFGSCIFAGGSK